MTDEVIEPLIANRGSRLPATPEEIIDSWTGLGGSVTVSPIDFGGVMRLGPTRFYPVVDKESLMSGWYGSFDKLLYIYVSRNIPVGYFYQGPRVPDLYPIPIPEGAERVIKRKMPFDVLMQIRSGLKPFNSTPSDPSTNQTSKNSL
jgi:hypothetical protein